MRQCGRRLSLRPCLSQASAGSQPGLSQVSAGSQPGLSRVSARPQPGAPQNSDPRRCWRRTCPSLTPPGRASRATAWAGTARSRWASRCPIGERENEGSGCRGRSKFSASPRICTYNSPPCSLPSAFFLVPPPPLKLPIDFSVCANLQPVERAVGTKGALPRQLKGEGEGKAEYDGMG